jgi:hypothetical protein
MSSSSLLSLPREIRNIIYSHLSHDITLDWGYRMFPFPLGGHCAVSIQVPDAPLPAVLLSCAQIYHEYSQDGRFRKPTITIGVDSTFRLLECEPTNQARVFEILGAIRQVDFFIKSVDGESARAHWASIDELSQAIAVLAPKLKTIRVIAKPVTAPMLDQSLLRSNTIVSSTVPSPPVLATHLLTFSKYAFWNESMDVLEYLTTGRKELEQYSTALDGEWLFTRGTPDKRLYNLKE